MSPTWATLWGCALSVNVFARFAKLKGYNVLYVCSTEEYGTSTEAVEERLTSRQI